MQTTADAFAPCRRSTEATPSNPGTPEALPKDGGPMLVRAFFGGRGHARRGPHYQSAKWDLPRAKNDETRLA